MVPLTWDWRVTILPSLDLKRRARSYSAVTPVTTLWLSHTKIQSKMILNNIKKTLISVTQWRSRHFNIQYFPVRYCGAMFLKYVMVNRVLWRNVHPIKQGWQWRSPSLFNKCTGFFYVHNTTQLTNGFTSHPKDEALMVKYIALEHKFHDWDSHTQLNRNSAFAQFVENCDRKNKILR